MSGLPPPFRLREKPQALAVVAPTPTPQPEPQPTLREAPPMTRALVVIEEADPEPAP